VSTFSFAYTLPGLRKSVADDTQTALGATQLPVVLAAIVKDALLGLRVPDVSRLPALFETLRVGANICIDHGIITLLILPRLVLTLHRRKQGPPIRVRVP
jgi:hypothetical protein